MILKEEKLKKDLWLLKRWVRKAASLARAKAFGWFHGFKCVCLLHKDIIHSVGYVPRVLALVTN